MIMKVFLSWSGTPSKEFAAAFHKWLPNVLPSVQPYYSPDDPKKAARWATEISKEMDECKIGMIFLTRDNLNASWLMFETNALAKKLEKSKVCPLLFDMELSDFYGPLAQFSAVKFDKVEIKRIVQMMNELVSE